MNDFIPNSTEIYNCFYDEKTEINDTFRLETQQQTPVLRQFILWKQCINCLFTPFLTIRANRGLLHYYCRFQHLGINESNLLWHCKQETQTPNSLYHSSS